MIGLSGIVGAIKGKKDEGYYKIRGKVVLMKRAGALDCKDLHASVRDRLHELAGKGVTFQLISSTEKDPNRGDRGKIGKPANLEKWITNISSCLTPGEATYQVTFLWDESFGIPGAVIIKNQHHAEFYLKTLTIEGIPIPGKERIHFECNSWVYPDSKYKYDRIFFANDTYLPSTMPEFLRPYRQDELIHLRGDSVVGQLQEHDRVYGYAYYNDLGSLDDGNDYVRPILGGAKYPYPRRGRTSRAPANKDSNYESRLRLVGGKNIYVPRDEKFGNDKLSEFIGFGIKSVTQALLPSLKLAVLDTSPTEFDTFEDVMKLYKGGIKLPNIPVFEHLRKMLPFDTIKELIRCDDHGRPFRLPPPQVIQKDPSAWRTDEEFGREMLAGVNPVVIRRLQEFPPKSKLDSKVYGDQTSRISAMHIEKNMDGLTVDKALENKRLFILDHHDVFMPYLTFDLINSLPKTLVYATRTLLFLKRDGILKPVAIELSLPNPKPEELAKGPKSKVYTPAEAGVEASIWQLAKAYVAVNDSCYHQLISHWLNTHAVIEPFIIATNRQLSIVHPIHKLLSPHFRDTMNINALARQTLVNAGGIFEATVFPGKYALRISSEVFKDWKLTEQALPCDLLKRGVAVEDPSSPHKLRLLIEDYPYAVDGLAIWSAIETWVNEYCAIYYASNHVIQDDNELQAWWKEIREIGFGDKKDELWWPAMQTIDELTKTCTTIIWVASALHAAVNFGQYPYAGYLPNRPTISRRRMPESGTTEYEELRKNPEKVFLRTVTSQFQTIIGVSLIEILSRHSSDEVYLGQRDTDEWTSDRTALEAFNKFGGRLKEIEEQIKSMNDDRGMRNRRGPVDMPYMLLYPNTSEWSRNGGGITAKGIPNSVSI